MNILLLIDNFGWAFDNISKNIIKYKTNKSFNYIVVPYMKLFNDINYIDINIVDHVLFFWYGNEVMNLFKKLQNFKNIKTFNLCIFDYSIWINNINKSDEKWYKSYIDYFISNLNNILYCCDK